MNKRWTRILQYAFFVGLGFLFVWLSLRNVTHEHWLQIKEAIRHSRSWLVIPVVILLLISHYSRALRWRMLMEPLGYAPSRFNTFAAVMIGYLVNAGVPRLGEVVKCTLLARYEKVRADRLIGTIVVERAFDAVCLVIIFLLAVLFQGEIFGSYLSELFSGFFSDKSGHVAVSKIIMIVGGLILFILLVYFLLKKFAHISLVSKIRNVLLGIWLGLSSIRNIRHKGHFLFHTALIWTLYLVSTTIGIYAIRETAPLGFGGGLVALAVGSVGMIVSPGGIGAYPYFIAKLVGLYGLPVDTIGRALGWLLWSVQTAIILLGGLVCLALLSRFNRDRNKTGEPAVQNTA